MASSEKEFKLRWCERGRVESVDVKTVCAICFDQKTRKEERKLYANIFGILKLPFLDVALRNLSCFGVQNLCKTFFCLLYFFLIFF